jgi:hypothetical protein
MYMPIGIDIDIDIEMQSIHKQRAETASVTERDKTPPPTCDSTA